MKSIPCLAWLLFTAALSAHANTVPARTTAGAVPATVISTAAPPVHIVMCRDGTDLDALIAGFELKPRFIYRPLVGFAAPMDAATIQRLKAHDCVLCVEADGPMSLAGLPRQTNGIGVVRMGVDRFPVAQINGLPKAPVDVDVAVIDTGIDPHPDLNVYTNVSIISANASDENGHGTLVAGVLGAIDNGFGIVGAAPGVRLWNIKILSPESNMWSNLTGAFSYVLQHANRVSVVNISLINGGNTNAPVGSIRLGIQRLVNAGIVVVAGAGNYPNDLAGVDGVYGTGDDAIPAAYPLVMAVSGMDPVTDTVWSSSGFSQIERTNNAYSGLSNYVFSPGGAIDVSAPCTDIFTTAPAARVGTNGGYLVESGTSFATAYVSGLVALYIAANGRATNAAGVYRIRQAIVDAALPQSQWNTTNTMDPDTNPEPLAITSEAWVPKPALTNHSGPPGAFQLGFATVPGYDYTVQATDDLTPPVAWTNVAQVSGSNFVRAASVTDSNAASHRFYRLARKSGLEVPPVIRSQSQDLRVPAGSNATFSVRVTGLAPLSYQWHRSGAPLSDGGSLSGAMTASLTLSNVQPGDAGPFTVIVTNEFGSVTSVVATLTVLTNWTSSTVTGVSASATSQMTASGHNASNTVNGTFNQYVYWRSLGVGEGFGHDPAPAITFDCGTARVIERVQIWNGPEAGHAARRLIVEVSSDGATFHPLDEFALALLSPASESLSLGGVVARYVRLVFQENDYGQIFPVGYAAWGGGGFIEIDEVQFHEYTGE